MIGGALWQNSDGQLKLGWAIQPLTRLIKNTIIHVEMKILILTEAMTTWLVILVSRVYSQVIDGLRLSLTCPASITLILLKCSFVSPFVEKRHL